MYSAKQGPSPETIEKQYQTFKTKYNDNIERGEKELRFTLASEQWDQGVAKARKLKNKESLTFNLTLKHRKKLNAQTRQVEFSLNLAALNDTFADKLEETASYRLILSHILLSENMTERMNEAMDKCGDYGYSFIELNFEQENHDTLCLTPVLRMHEDPSIAFWDLSAQDPTRVDGRFCGMRRKVSRGEFLTKFPKYKDADNWLSEADNIVIDYWYRVYEDADYQLMKGGVYRRVELLTQSDRENNVATEDDLDKLQEKLRSKNKLALVKKSPVCKIMFMRTCGEKVITAPEEFPTDDLPLYYHPAFTVWVPEGYKTFPFTFVLKGSQELHNFINSQLATSVKNANATKWFFDPKNIPSAEDIVRAKGINMAEGAFVFPNKEDHPIIKHAPDEIQASLLQFSEQSKREMEDLTGGMMDGQPSDNVVVGNEALKRITENISVMQTGVIAKHIYFVNMIGKGIGSMIPRLFTEERTLVVNKQDNTTQAITINKLTPTLTTINNVRDINNNFNYSIKAGPSSAMEKENTMKYLQGIFTINPQAFNLVADIYASLCPSPRADELERRFATLVSPQLIQYSQGAMSKEQFTQANQQQQQSQMQQQMQMMTQNPQFKSMMEAVAAETMKAQAANKKAEVAQFEAETKRMTAIAGVADDQVNTGIAIAAQQQESQDSQIQHGIQEARLNLEHVNQVIEVEKMNRAEST